MTCPICAHTQRPAINAALHARQAARAKGQAPADGLGVLARSFGVLKSHLSHHRDTCDLGSPDATQAGTSAQAGERVIISHAPTRTPERATTLAASIRKELPQIIEVGTDVVEVVDSPTPPPAGEKTRAISTGFVKDQILNRVHVKPANLPPKSDRIYAIARLVKDEAWRGHDSVIELSTKWSCSPQQIYEDHKLGCALLKLARGDLVQELEASAVRWLSLYEEAKKSESKTKIRDAAEALKGYDRVVGLIDQGAKVQVNIAQSPQAQEMLRMIFEILREEEPGVLERVRRKMAERRSAGMDMGSMVSVVTVEDQG